MADEREREINDAVTELIIPFSRELEKRFRIWEEKYPDDCARMLLDAIAFVLQGPLSATDSLDVRISVGFQILNRALEMAQIAGMRKENNDNAPRH